MKKVSTNIINAKKKSISDSCEKFQLALNIKENYITRFSTVDHSINKKAISITRKNDILNLQHVYKTTELPTIAIIGKTKKQADAKKIKQKVMPINTPDRRLGINDLRAQIMEQIVIYKSSLPAQIGFNELGSAVNVLFRNSIVSSIYASINRQTYKTQITNFTLKKSFDKQGIETGFGDKDFRSNNNYISQL